MGPIPAQAKRLRTLHQPHQMSMMEDPDTQGTKAKLKGNRRLRPAPARRANDPMRSPIKHQKAQPSPERIATRSQQNVARTRSPTTAIKSGPQINQPKGNVGMTSHPPATISLEPPQNRKRIKIARATVNARSLSHATRKRSEPILASTNLM